MRILQSRFRPIKRILNLIVNFRLSFFLVLCLTLGGTSQNIVTPKLPLYLYSLFMIGISMNALNKDSRLWQLKPILLIWIVFFFTHMLYLIPLPPSLWGSLGGREIIRHGFEILEVSLPWLPISVTPEKTLFSLFDFLPILAIILMIGTVVSSREFRFTLWTLGVSVIGLAILGLLQVSGSFPGLYFYEFTDTGSAVGVFSNANHYGVLLLMCIPLIVFLADYHRENANFRVNITYAFCVVAVLSAVLGIGLSGSLSGYLLFIPVFAMALFLWTSGEKLKYIYLIGIVISFLGFLLFDIFLWNDLHSEITDKFTSTDKMSRTIMFENSYEIGKTYFPFGSGPGSFSDSYRLIEETTRLTVPHAHNDYIELFVEFGILGLIGISLTILWLTKLIFTSFSAKRRHSNLAKYLAISICLVVVHSLIDYPLRTIAIMALASFYLCSILLSHKDSSLLDYD